MATFGKWMCRDKGVNLALSFLWQAESATNEAVGAINLLIEQNFTLEIFNRGLDVHLIENVDEIVS